MKFVGLLEFIQHSRCYDFWSVGCVLVLFRVSCEPSWIWLCSDFPFHDFLSIHASINHQCMYAYTQQDWWSKMTSHKSSKHICMAS